MPIQGRSAALRVTGTVATTSTGVAATRSTGPGAGALTGHVRINNVAQQIIDPDSTPVLLLNSTAVPATDYSVNHIQGKFQWNAGDPPVGTYTANIEYLTATSVAGGREWSLNIDQDMLEVTEFGSSGWKEYQPNMAGAGGSFTRYWNDPTFFDYVETSQRFVIELVTNSADNNRYQGFAYVNSDQLGASVDSLVTETVNYQVDGAVYYSTE